jgi:aminoglycoside phosphotransferase (APT) family kinase protein
VDADEVLRAPLGPLVAEGAEATIHAVDDARVVRVARDGRSMGAEARVMAFVRGAGYPAPEVFGLSPDGSRLLLERVAGPTLLDALLSGEIGATDAGRLLGELHQRLHDLEPPAWVGAVAPGADPSLLHLDLHPANVLLGRAGPVVIDWTNAAAGPPGLDVADAHLVMASFPAPPGDLVRLQSELLAAFAPSSGVPDPSPWFDAVLERRAADPHFSAEQVALMRSAAGR